MTPTTYQLTHLNGETSFNRVELYSVPQVGDELTIVHGFGTDYTLAKVTRVRHLARRCDEDQLPDIFSTRLVIWCEEILPQNDATIERIGFV